MLELLVQVSFEVVMQYRDALRSLAEEHVGLVRRLERVEGERGYLLREVQARWSAFASLHCAVPAGLEWTSAMKISH